MISTAIVTPAKGAGARPPDQAPAFGDALHCVLFHDAAEEILPSQLARVRVGPHYTNTRDGCVARRILERQRGRAATHHRRQAVGDELPTAASTGTQPSIRTRAGDVRRGRRLPQGRHHDQHVRWRDHDLAA
jgi:hypothetical protein